MDFESTIVILTKNAKEHIENVLCNLLLQESPERFEVIVIDSGSTDGTLEILEKHSIRVVNIAPLDFNHGRTRNLGVSLARGKFVCFLTQDAVPQDEFWLENLVRNLRNDEMAAGVYSRHIPREGCFPMERRRLLEFPLIGKSERIVNEITDRETYDKEFMGYIFFSNTSSCIRKEVWEEIPFREVTFAEDQDWAKRILEAGYKTVYEPDSVVVHSHNYATIENLMRHFEHATATRKLFDHREVPSLGSAATSILREIRGDWRFFIEQNYSHLARIKWILLSSIYQTIRFTAMWCGTYYRKFPGKITERLCLQEKIIKQGTQST